MAYIEENQRPVKRTSSAHSAAHKSTQRPAGAVKHHTTPKKNVKRRKKSFNPLPIIIVLLALVILGICWVGGLFGGSDDVVTPVATQAPTTANTDSLFGTTNTTNDDYSDLVASEQVNIDMSDLSVTEGLDETWFNVLLLGGDTKVVTERGRTDTMMICSINMKTGRVKLTSILRDTAVKVEGKTRHINTAYFYGGPALAIKTVNEYFDMNIQYYAYVDFSGFATIATELGGVEMDVTENEVDQINENVAEQYELAYKQGKLDYDTAKNAYYSTKLTTPGSQIHLDGMQTLGYARIRKLDSDMARAERQRKVLNALMLKMKGADISKIMTIVAKCSGSYVTNLDIQTIINVSSLVLGNGDLSSVESLRLPIQGSYKEEVRNEEAMLYDMDVSENSRALYNFIYNS